MKYLSFLLFSLTLSATSLAQDLEITPVSSESNDHYLSYADALTLRLYGITKFTQITYQDKEQGDDAIYKANDNFNLGAGFNYKWLGLNLAFNFPFMNKDDHLLGKTTAFDIQGNFYGRKNLVDVTLQSYEGYYWKNVDNFFPKFNPEERGYPKRGDLTTANISASFFHVYNHEKFSYRAAFVQNERQVKSAGSWLLGGYFTAFGIATKDSTFILPREYVSRIKDNTLHVSEVQSVHLGIAGGYAHTFVIKEKWFASFTLNIGAGLKSVERTIPDGRTFTSNKGGGFGFFRMALGHNNDRTFYGITSIVNTLGMQLEKTMDINYQFGAIRLIYARRFNVK